MACTAISIPAALMTALAGLDGKYVTMISNAEFMCQVRGYLIDDMLIGKYRELVASQLGTALVYMSTTIMTIWVAYQGFMIISGENRNPILPLFLRTGKMALILSLVALIAGKSPVIADAVLDFQGLITAAIVGAGTDIYQVIDINLAMAQVFNAVVDGLAGGQQAGADGKSLTTIAGLVGQSGPAVLVSVLAVMAEISITLAIMLAPLFIFFLLFQQTSAMFWTWAKFLLGTMVSLAVLTLLGSIVLDMMMRYGAAVVAAFYVNGMLSAAGVGAGFDIGGSAMQLAALGSLSTALLMMVPPLIMQFFNSGASFAAGAMMGAMGGGAAAGGAAALARAMGGQSGGSAGQGALGGAGSNGETGQQGLGYSGPVGGSANSNNQMALNAINRSAQGSGLGSVGYASYGQPSGSAGLANRSSENTQLAQIQAKQSNGDGEFRSGGERQMAMANAADMQVDPVTGVYRTTGSDAAMANDSTLGRGGHLKADGGSGSVGAGNGGQRSASRTENSVAQGGASTPASSGTPTHMGDKTSVQVTSAAPTSRPAVPYGRSSDSSRLA